MAMRPLFMEVWAFIVEVKAHRHLFKFGVSACLRVGASLGATGSRVEGAK